MWFNFLITINSITGLFILQTMHYLTDDHSSHKKTKNSKYNNFAHLN